VSELWAAYLDQPIDYSEAFRDRVAALGAAVSTALGVPVGHDTDMNYRAGQLLTVYIGPDGAPVADRAAAGAMLRVAISSRGPLWTVMAFGQDSPRHWSPTAVPTSPVLVPIEAALTGAGLGRVPSDRLDDVVPNHETDLDGAPATLRDVLFCEIC
jgi:hypothetical protein